MASPAPAVAAAAASAAAARPRRAYIDWLRGLAVVIMIEAHTFDAWTAQPSRDSLAFWYVQLIAGWGAPIFLFLAGVSVALASGGRLRRAEKEKRNPHPSQGEMVVVTVREVSRSDRRTVFEAARPMIWRGAQIFLLALLFRVQAWALSPGATLYGILKVDILNIMGPAISAAALVWGLVPRAWTRIVALCAVASALGLLTPIVRSSTALAALPDPIEWYFRPWAGRTTFTFFPWAGFVFAGAAIGVLLDRVREANAEARLNLRFAIAGTAIAAAAFGASYLPSPYASSYFWTSSPCFFFLRVGLLILFLPLAYLWAQRPAASRETTRPERALDTEIVETATAAAAAAASAAAAAVETTGAMPTDPGPTGVAPRGAAPPAWDRRRLLAWWPASPMLQFGRTSLFVYWIHVEMVYGILSYPLHRNLTLAQAFVAFVLFTIAMLYLSVVKTRVVDRWRDRNSDRNHAVGLAPASI